MSHAPRVVIPENPRELFTLIVAIHKQDQVLGDKSPLRMMEVEVNIDKLGPEAVEALALQKEIDEGELHMKNLYGRRQLYIDSMTPYARGARTTLLGVYSLNPRQLTTFGYDVKITEAPKKQTA